MKIKKTLIFCMIICCGSIYPKAIIWDLGLTLVKPDTHAIAQKLGVWDSALLFFKFGSMTHEIINEAMINCLTDGTEKSDGLVACDPNGRVMPNIMCDWLKGKRDCASVRASALKKADEYTQYLGKRHKRIIKKTFEWMFTPELFGTQMKAIKQATALVRRLNNKTDENGKSLHTQYVCSNWDPESFMHLYTNPANRLLFKYIPKGNMIISGFVKDIKPNTSIFNFLLKKFNLKPEDCIFIDDQEENCKAAEAVGITAIQLIDGNYHKLRRELKKLGIL